MEIKIEGLSPLQAELADMIWRCDSQEDVDQLIGGMPKHLADKARVVRELMMWAVWDGVVETQQQFPVVGDLVDRLKQ